MRRARVACPFASFAVAVVLAGCAAAPPPTAAEQSSLGEQLQAAGPVYVLDSGHYPGSYIYHGSHYDSIWVDLSIRNDAYDKRAGIVSSSDGWQTSHTSDAHYKGALADGRERWGLDVIDAVVQGYGVSGEVEYAAFVVMNGQTSWSPFRDHYIYDRVTPAEPLRLLRSAATADASGVAVHGLVRALNVPGTRRVFVRYTVDGWQHQAELEATAQAGDFAFTLPVGGDPAQIDEVAFALRLEAGGETAWDDAGGANYHVRLAPQLLTATWTNATPAPSSGIKVLTGGVGGALPVTAITVHVDDGSTISLPPSGTGFWLVYDTSALADGTHAFAVDLTAGPFVRRLALPSLAVVGTVRALGGRAVGGDGDTPWDFLTVGDATYVLGEQHVLRYTSDGAAPQVFEASGAGGLQVGNLAVDAAGRAYALTNMNAVARWNADGTLDRSFGQSGVRALAGSYDGVELCYAADLAADGNGLYVVDSCNTRLLRFALDGSFVDSLSLADGGFDNALHTTWRGDELWISRSSYAAGQPRSQLARVAVAPGAPMRVTATQPLGALAVDSVAFAGDGLWVTSSNNLYRLGSDGSVMAEWTGGGSPGGAAAGSLEVARRVSVRADGSVDVLSTGSGRIERFALRGDASAR